MMPIPDFQTLMLPVLKFAAKHEEHSLSEATDFLAVEFSLIDTKVVLVDGKRLADLMIDFDVGVSTVASYQLKRIDSDYFIDTLV